MEEDGLLFTDPEEPDEEYMMDFDTEEMEKAEVLDMNPEEWSSWLWSTVYGVPDVDKDGFPDAADLETDDPEKLESSLVAVGGTLTPERLVEAYSKGIFPWFSFRDSPVIKWHCPTKRFVIFPAEIHVSHSMRTLMNKGKYRLTRDRAFRQVIEGCAETDGRFAENGAWLGPDMIEAYCLLHEQGHAMSVEVWEGEELVGGLYGVRSGRVFAGESMFSRVPSASKLALIYLARTLEKEGVGLIDCQFETPHLLSMGGRHIPYREYIAIMRAAKISNLRHG